MTNSILTADRQYVPKYVDLARDLLRRIAEEQLAVGDRLGTEAGLSEQYGLSRVTVRQALELLEQSGYVERKPARGTFVARTVPTLDQLAPPRGCVLLLCSNQQKSDSDDDFAFRTVLHAMEQALARKGLMMQLMGVGNSPTEDRQRLSALLSREELRGVISIGPCIDGYGDLLADTPVVATCTFQPSRFPWVGVDVAEASKQLVTYLLEHGHQRIALVCGSWVDGEAFASFAMGMKQAMESRGLTPDRSLMAHNYPGESLGDLAKEMLSRDPRPTAIFCENWRVCEAVIGACSRLNLAIPDDVSLVGYGLNVSQMREPRKITAYVPDTAKVGEMAADLLGTMLSGDALPAQPLIVSGNLVVGDSVKRL